MTISDAILQYYRQISPPAGLSSEIDILHPYASEEIFPIISQFYNKYYNDHQTRIACFGINPGRLGGGLTGIPFTDPVKLHDVCGIEHHFPMKGELSSGFIYEMIDAFGGPESFYASFYITSISPLGFMRDGVNLNYYDIKGFEAIFKDYAIEEIEKQLSFGLSSRVAFCIGTGKNHDFLLKINKERAFFDNIIALPHPRWVMQYRSKTKDRYIDEYVQQLKRSLNLP